MGADFLDRYSRGNSLCHRMPAGLKLAMMLGVILLSVVLPASLWPIHGCLACLIFVAHTLAGIPVSYVLHRLALCLPLVALIALSVPLSQGFAAGWELAGTILLRATLAFLAGLWLVNTTPFEQILSTLRAWKVPRLFVTLLEFMYRYIFVLFDELARMRAAQRARTFGRRRFWTVWAQNAKLLATLIIRAFNRAERIHGAMLARGWNGNPRKLQ